MAHALISVGEVPAPLPAAETWAADAPSGASRFHQRVARQLAVSGWEREGADTAGVRGRIPTASPSAEPQAAEGAKTIVHLILILQ
jgi:hypothetical protein